MKGMEIGKNIDVIPQKPVISRFVAPWDTSGWYGVWGGFSKGSRLYSNSEVCVEALLEYYCGGEYVRTYNSYAEGFDDKQEVDFFVEQLAFVYVAVDTAAPADFLPDFMDTGDIMVSTDKCTYRILQKKFEAGQHVHIPGFSGQCNHFVVFAKPVNEQKEAEKYHTLEMSCDLPPYARRDYKWYYNEVFNLLEGNDVPHGFNVVGEYSIRRYAFCPQRKYLELKDNALLSRSEKTSGSDIFEAALQVKCGTVTVSFCGAAITLSNGQAQLSDGSIVKDGMDDTYNIRFVRNVQKGQCTIWLNCRACKSIPCEGGIQAAASVEAGTDSVIVLDRISLRDDTDVFIVNEAFDTLPDFITPSEGTDVKAEEYPFITNKSMSIEGDASACVAYPFSPVEEILSIETKVKVEKDSFALLPEVRSSDGQVVLKIAMYKNVLYASQGKNWHRIFQESNGWMYYPCGNWYNIRVIIDIKKNIYDLFVDGAKKASGFSLADSVGDAAQAIYYSHSGRMYINELRIYDAASLSRGLIPPGPVFDVSSAPYNASGKGDMLETKAIQQALDDAAFTGGTVYLHDGTFFSGCLQIYSDTTLFVSPSAVLLGTQDHKEYPLKTPGESLCAARQLGRGLLYGQNLCNIRVTGGGTMDGNGLYRFKMNDPNISRVLDARPDMIYIAYSDGIALEDIRLQNSAFWTVVPLSCRNVVMQHLDLDCMNTPNRDGIDPVDCRDMTIRDCRIMAGDDGICFKSSDIFGCENIDVGDMLIQSLASGIKFGTDTYYSFKNIRVRNCAVKNVNRCGVSLETVDGAEIENLAFEEIDMTDVGAPVYISIGIRGRRPKGNHPIRYSSINGVSFTHMRFDKPYAFSYTKNIRENMIIGESSEQSVRNVKFNDCRFYLPGGFTEIPPAPNPNGKQYPEYDRHGLSAGHGFTIRYGENIIMENCHVFLKQPDVRPVAAYFDYKEI